jgi:hypothetical protein
MGNVPVDVAFMPGDEVCEVAGNSCTDVGVEVASEVCGDVCFEEVCGDFCVESCDDTGFDNVG